MKALIWSLVFSLALVGHGMSVAWAQEAGDDGPDKEREQRFLHEPEHLKPKPLPYDLPGGPIVVQPDGFYRRYLVTYMKSRDDGVATVVTVTNQSQKDCRIRVEWQAGFSTVNACVTEMTVAPGHTTDFCSRGLPSVLTTCNSTCNPDLGFHEGKAYVSSGCSQVGVSSRVYYTHEEGRRVAAITDSKIVKLNSGNIGD